MNKSNKKQVYTSPQIERIELDNEISLVLQSQQAPPTGPGEPTSFAPDYFNQDPFKTNVG